MPKSDGKYVEGKREATGESFISTSGIYGSIKGIAGTSINDISFLETSSDDEIN